MTETKGLWKRLVWVSEVRYPEDFIMFLAYTK